MGFTVFASVLLYFNRFSLSFDHAIAFSTVNGLFIVQNTAEHIAANKVDHNNGASIKRLIDNYEKENNIKVTKLGYKYDFEPSQYAYSIRPMQSMTERKFACLWSIIYTMNYYCDRRFEKVEYVEPERDERNYFNHMDLNYDEFLDEQIYFHGDTIYMVVY